MKSSPVQTKTLLSFFSSSIHNVFYLILREKKEKSKKKKKITSREKVSENVTINEDRTRFLLVI